MTALRDLLEHGPPSSLFATSDDDVEAEMSITIKNNNTVDTTSSCKHKITCM